MSWWRFGAPFRRHRPGDDGSTIELVREDKYEN